MAQGMSSGQGGPGTELLKARPVCLQRACGPVDLKRTRTEKWIPNTGTRVHTHSGACVSPNTSPRRRTDRENASVCGVAEGYVLEKGRDVSVCARYGVIEPKQKERVESKRFFQVSVVIERETEREREKMGVRVGEGQRARKTENSKQAPQQGGSRYRARSHET